MDANDHELLRQYTREGSQVAFAELVRRHLNLVYSAAQRQVHSTALAEDVVQSVFFDLSRNAAQLKPGTPLVAWLHLVTRRTAIDAIRRESRRQAREQVAFEISEMKPNPSVWTELEPLLDAALEKLPEVDRTAVLLRFFENKSLREVGEQLGASEEAAQKRVARALDRLRAIFAKQGIAVGAAGLATELSAHALQVAPATLSATLASTTFPGAVAVLKTTEAIAMTTLQKSLITAGFVVLVGGGIFEAREIVQQRAAIASQRQSLAKLESETLALRLERESVREKTAAADRKIDLLLAKAGAASSAEDLTMEVQMKEWLARLDQLKQLRNERRDLAPPDLQLLDESTLFVYARDAKFDTESQIRDLFARLRERAGSIVAREMRIAVDAYVKANAGMLPSTPEQLGSYISAPLDPALLGRYEMLSSGLFESVPKGERAGVMGIKAPIDVTRDKIWFVGPDGYSSIDAMSYNLRVARQKFSAAQPGQRATEASQLLPYLKWPVDYDTLQKELNPPRHKSK